MVPTVSQILTKNETFPLNQNLKCTHYDKQVATCVMCHQPYIGQTVNKFSMRWSSYRGTWNRRDNMGRQRPNGLIAEPFSVSRHPKWTI